MSKKIVNTYWAVWPNTGVGILMHWVVYSARHYIITLLSDWSLDWHHTIGRSKGGTRDARPPGVQILSFSCSFQQKFEKIIPILGVGAPPLEKILDPPRHTQVYCLAHNKHFSSQGTCPCGRCYVNKPKIIKQNQLQHSWAPSHIVTFTPHRQSKITIQAI